MTTFVNLRNAVSIDLRDPDNKVFVDAVVGDMVQAGLAEIGRVAPRRFQEDLDPVLNEMEYQLLVDDFTVAVPEIEVMRVELWNVTSTPHRPVRLVAPGAGEYANFSAAGWNNRDGILELPYWVPKQVGASTADYAIRVWGYAPYAPISADGDIVPLSNEKEQALRMYARVEALRRLTAERDLFSQWQTRAGNSDVSPASLMSGLDRAQEEWRRLSRAIAVLREAPG